jgi:hypothetical protein
MVNITLSTSGFLISAISNLMDRKQISRMALFTFRIYVEEWHTLTGKAISALQLAVQFQ